MFGLARKRTELPEEPLYRAAVARARDPDWYRLGGAADTVDGRFDVLALVLSLIVIRLQRARMGQAEADLADRFARDMDSNLRELGVGDLSISKHVGRTVGALGGRVSAYREALAGGDAAVDEALVRNLWRGTPPELAAIDWTRRRVVELARRLESTPAERLMDAL